MTDVPLFFVLKRTAQTLIVIQILFSQKEVSDDGSTWLLIRILYKSDIGTWVYRAFFVYFLFETKGLPLARTARVPEKRCNVSRISIHSIASSRSIRYNVENSLEKFRLVYTNLREPRRREWGRPLLDRLRGVCSCLVSSCRRLSASTAELQADEKIRWSSVMHDINLSFFKVSMP